MTKEQHIHKFRRLKYKSGNTIFFCAMPDCNKKMNIALSLGKRSLCWRCGEPFIMNEYSLRLAKPHCENCHKPKDAKEEPLSSPIIDVSDSPLKPTGSMKLTNSADDLMAQLNSVRGELNTHGRTSTIEPTIETVNDESEGDI